MKKPKQSKVKIQQHSDKVFDLVTANHFYGWSHLIVSFSMGFQLAALTMMFIQKSPAVFFWGPVIAVVSVLAKKAEINLRESILLKRSDLLIPLVKTQTRWNGFLIGFSFLIVCSFFGVFNSLQSILSEQYPTLTSRAIYWITFLISSVISGVVGNFAYDQIKKRFLTP